MFTKIMFYRKTYFNGLLFLHFIKQLLLRTMYVKDQGLKEINAETLQSYLFIKHYDNIIIGGDFRPSLQQRITHKLHSNHLNRKSRCVKQSPFCFLQTELTVLSPTPKLPAIHRGLLSLKVFEKYLLLVSSAHYSNLVAGLYFATTHGTDIFSCFFFLCGCEIV